MVNPEHKNNCTGGEAGKAKRSLCANANKCSSQNLFCITHAAQLRVRNNNVASVRLRHAVRACSWGGVR